MTDTTYSTLVLQVNYYLSKSDFKIARDCRTKLYYKKHKFPSAKDYDEYMVMLADGGFMIGKMAQLLFPEGQEVNTGSQEKDIERTNELLQNENITLFEPAIHVNNKLIRIDILVKRKNAFDLIEVKSKSYDSDEHQLKIQTNKKYFGSGWNNYLEDVAYQTLVLEEYWEGAKVTPYLMMPDKAKTTGIDSLISWFKLIKKERKSGRKSVEVEFIGDVEALRKDNFLEKVDVTAEVNARRTEVTNASNKFLQDLAADNRFVTPPNIKCKSCEYCLEDKEHPKSGFEICWGRKPEPKPEILTLAQLGNFNRSGGAMDKLIQAGKTSFKDLKAEDFKGSYNNRPYFQLAKKEEFLLDGIEEKMALEYPLHFIDFETSQLCVPYHANMRPYERVFFQWSCHTIERPGEEPSHVEWINTNDYYPSFEGMESLRKYLGSRGSVLIWSPYENTIMKEVHTATERRAYNNDVLRKWLSNIAKFDNEDEEKLVDMHKLCKLYYFHPLMGGRTSIKVVLPAVLEATNNPGIESLLNNEGLLRKDSNGEIVDPYEVLDEVQIKDRAVQVADGTGAMRAYQDMLYGEYKEDLEVKESYKKALLKYCKLDTLAMVIIWQHWQDLISL